MQWTALVPMKQGGQTKSRLADVLDRPARLTLAQTMLAHVIGCLRGVDAIDDIYLLAPAPVAGLDVTWLADGGTGLNTELSAWRGRLPDKPLLVIHADMPHLATEDVTALLSAAEQAGAAIAPDRHGLGTNALALVDDRPFDFAFGCDSLSRHVRLRPDAAIVRRSGLAFDLDTPEDLAQALRAAVIDIGG